MRKALLLLSFLAITGCTGGGSDGAGGSASTGALSTHAASGTGHMTSTGSGALGPTASIRLVNLVPGTTFDVWGPDTNQAPVSLKTGIQFGTISDYIAVPIGPAPIAPTAVLLPSGQAPASSPDWELLASSGPDRALLQEVGMVAGERATLILDLDTKLQQVAPERLEEWNLPANDPSQATLHIAARVSYLTPAFVEAFGVVGQPRLTTDGLATPDTWHVAPGAFDFGLYNLQMVNTCTTPLATTHLDVPAGKDELVVIYHQGSQVSFVTAPIQ